MNTQIKSDRMAYGVLAALATNAVLFLLLFGCVLSSGPLMTGLQSMRQQLATLSVTNPTGWFVVVFLVGLTMLIALIGVGLLLVWFYMVSRPAKLPQLQVQYGWASPSSLPLTHDYIRLGQAPNNDICLLDETAAFRHAIIRLVQRRYFVQSLDDEGLYVNDRLVQASELHVGDRVQIGRTVFVVE